MTDILQKYLDIYDNSPLRRPQAPALMQASERARKFLEGKKLPQKGSEGYEKTSIGDILANALCSERGPEMTPQYQNRQEGVVVLPLSKGAELYPRLFEKYYGKVSERISAEPAKVTAALNTLLADDGLFILIQRNALPDNEIRLETVAGLLENKTAFRRVLIVAEENSRADISFIEKAADREMNETALSQVVEIHVAPRASVNICDLEETSPRFKRLSQYFVSVQREATVNLTAATLHNGVSRNEIYVNLDEKGANAVINGMVVGSQRQHVDNYTFISHNIEGCTSGQLFRYVLDGRSQGAFAGMIHVAPGARYTSAEQTNNNILASKEARMFTKPQLLIYNDDVKCSHGATTGQLDQRELFYMQTRGIPREQARTMLMQAFVDDVVERIPSHPMRAHLKTLLETRFPH